jgi:AraC family transcriptional regulator
MKCTAPGGHTPNKLDCTSVFPIADADDAALVLGVEDNLRTVISHTPFLLTRCSAELRYLFVSDAYARMLGLRPEQIIDKPIPEMMGEKGFKTILPHVRRVLQGEYVEYESEVHYKSVGARSIRAIYTPERDNQGSVKGWVASIIDMSHQKVADPGVGPCRFSATDGSRKDPDEDDGALQSPGCVETAVSNPTVEISPPGVVRRRSITSHGMTAEVVQSASPIRVEYRFCEPVHLLVIYEDGARRDGETFVEGLPRTNLRRFARKLTFVPARHRYHEWHEPRTPSRLMYFYFDPAQLRFHSETDIAAASFAPNLYFEDERLWNTTLKLAELVEHPTPRNTLYFEALGAVIVYELLRLHCGEPSSQSPVRGGLASWQQRIATAYIEEHLSERIELATLAHLVRQSPFHFCRMFKQSFGMPPHLYQTKRRIEHAKLLLAKPAMSMTEIGLTIGFGCSSSFATAFRKLTGFTPTEYQRSLG